MPSDLLAFLEWYLTLIACGLLALPLAFELFRHLPERGYAFAKPLGLLTVGYVFWLLGSLGFLRNDVPGLLFAAAGVGGLGLIWGGRAGLAALRGWLREQRAVVVGIELVFAVAFAAMALARAYNPDINNTEKPMEFMFINAIMRSETFPPNDAWLSGHAISYYYFGYVIVASLARLTGTPTAVAFNLGLALLFALAAVGALGVVMNLIALSQRFPTATGHKGQGARPTPQSSNVSPDPAPDLAPRPGGETRIQPTVLEGARRERLSAVFWPALLGPLLVLTMGNFYGVLRIANANGILADFDVWAVRYDFGDLSTGGVTRPAVRAGWVNLWAWLDLKGADHAPGLAPSQFTWDPESWWWFSGARVVHDRDLVGRETEAIDEMPAFSFILGDMHPHVLALPFVILGVALALEWLLWGRESLGDVIVPTSAFRLPTSQLREPHTAGRIVASAVLLGGLSFLNTWDFPIYGFLTVVALAIGLGLRWGWGGLWDRWLSLGLMAIALAALSVALYFPFYLTLQSQAGGILPNLVYPTRLQQTVVFFGPVLIGVTMFLAWLAARGRAVLDRTAALWAGGGILAVLVVGGSALAFGASLTPDLSRFADQSIAPLTRDDALRLLLQRRLVDSPATLFPLALIALAVGLGVGALRHKVSVGAKSEVSGLRPASRDVALPAIHEMNVGDEGLRSPAVLLVLAMILTGALLLIGPEFVYLRDNFGTRMNTLFKFYFQTWTLWALASAFGLWYVLQRVRGWGRWLAAGAMSLAMAAGWVYTAAGLYSKAGHFAQEPTLDGMAYFARSYPSDWAAIEWLQANVPGTPVIAETVGGAYRVEESRIAMATGLPTIMGWTNHEGQWRGEYYEQVAERPIQISTLYQARDWNSTQAILEAYGIEYVYVGALERSRYQPVYLPKFDLHMEVVFQHGDVTIYRRSPLQLS